MAEQESAKVLTKRAATQAKNASRNGLKAVETVVDEVVVEPVIEPVVDETVNLVQKVYARRKDLGLVGIGIGIGVVASGPVKTKVGDFREKRAAKKAEKKDAKLKVVVDTEGKGVDGEIRRGREAS